MSLKDRINQIVRDAIPQYVNTQVGYTQATNNTQQQFLGIVVSVGNGTAVVSFPDGSTQSATISTGRPIGQGDAVLVVGGVLI